MTLKDYHPFLSAAAKAEYLAHNDERAKAWPVPCECRTVETPHGRTFLRVSGPRDAPPLVLLPGGATHSLMWIPAVADLARRFRTYALDSILDVGRSANSVPIKTAEDLTEWLDGLFDALKLGSRLRLMGLSHGGWLAANYAWRHADRVDELVLLAPAAWILPLRPVMLLKMTQILLPPRRFFIRRAYEWSLPNLVASGREGRQRIDEMTEDLALAFRCFGMRRMTQLVAPTVADDEVLRGLGRSVPTVFVIGENERIYSCPEAIARLEHVAPQIARVVIPGVGHDLVWLAADRVCAAVGRDG